MSWINVHMINKILRTSFTSYELEKILTKYVVKAKLYNVGMCVCNPHPQVAQLTWIPSTGK